MASTKMLASCFIFCVPFLQMDILFTGLAIIASLAYKLILIQNITVSQQLFFGASGIFVGVI